MARRNGKLTDKQQRFVEEYCVTYNATQAYVKVYGVSQKVAEANGPRLLGNARVEKAISTRLQRINARTEITAERVLREYARLAFSDMQKFAEWDADKVNLFPSDTLSDDDTSCVAELSQTITKEGGSIRFKLHDKKGALDFLAKHLELAKDPIAEAIRETGGLSILLSQRNGDSDT